MHRIRRRRRDWLVAAVAAAALLVGACGGGSHTPAAVSPGNLSFVVRVSDNVFTPKALTVPSGTSVTWVWSGKNKHSVVGTFGSQDVHSPTHQGSGELSVTLHTPGTWEYECGVHGKAMSASITVN
ncbi:cupredoxin domain-containing protein [bacterium]|jgi:plastocyanin|nr:cupredoxin domain-containing protein [bacterium]